MEYQAKYGKVNTGDYVVVVTNDYMHRRSDIDVGLVGDDDYVYMGITYYLGQAKVNRRKIGSLGCPVCRIPSTELSDNVKRDLNDSFKLQKQLRQGKTVRRFDTIVVETYWDKDNNVVKTIKQSKRMSTTTLPIDASFQDIHKKLFKNMRSHCPDGYHSVVTLSPGCFFWGKEVSKITRELFFKECGSYNYRDCLGNPCQIQ